MITDFTEDMRFLEEWLRRDEILSKSAFPIQVQLFYGVIYHGGKISELKGIY